AFEIGVQTRGRHDVARLGKGVFEYVTHLARSALKNAFVVFQLDAHMESLQILSEPPRREKDYWNRQGAKTPSKSIENAKHAFPIILLGVLAPWRFKTLGVLGVLAVQNTWRPWRLGGSKKTS